MDEKEEMVVDGGLRRPAPHATAQRLEEAFRP